MRAWVVLAREAWNETVDVLGVRASVLDALDVGHTALTAKGSRWHTVVLEGWDTAGGPRERCFQVLVDPDKPRCHRCPDAAVAVDLLSHHPDGFLRLCRIHLEDERDYTPVVLTCGACARPETMPRYVIDAEFYGPPCLCGGNDWRYPNGNPTPFRRSGGTE